MMWRLFFLCQLLILVWGAPPAQEKFTAKSCGESPLNDRCYAAFPVFAFDSKTGKCEATIWGGCSSTANRFKTLEDCIAGTKMCDAKQRAGPLIYGNLMPF